MPQDMRPDGSIIFLNKSVADSSQNDILIERYMAITR